MAAIPDYLYNGLLGSRLFNSRLVIKGFEPADYDDLWELAMNEVIAPMLLRRGMDYYNFLTRTALRYAKQRRVDPIGDQLVRNRPDELDTQQQLALIKYYIQRRKLSGYGTEEEE